MKESDIFVGVVAYMDVETLNNDPRIEVPVSPVPRNGPFVCIRMIGRTSVWAHLVGRQPRYDYRLEIPTKWRFGGTDLWRTSPGCFLGDGATTYTGPNEAFVHAARGDKYYIGRRIYTPPRISMEGVQAILGVVAMRTGHTDTFPAQNPLTTRGILD